MSTSTLTETALNDVIAERQRQDAQWGDHDHDAFVYCAVLTEECGEVAQAIHDMRFESASVADVRRELVQVAAVAVQLIERIDGGRWRP